MDYYLAFSLVFFFFLFLAFCLGRALLPLRKAFILLPVKDKAEDLEQRLYALIWLKTLGIIRCPIYILDQGLSGEGQTLVSHLTSRWVDLKLCETFPPSP
ncbi:MAG: hypothetical protein R3Y63_07010 [Eubacteriales bacterium]